MTSDIIVRMEQRHVIQLLHSSMWKIDTNWHSSTLAECLWRPNGMRAQSGAFQQWQQHQWDTSAGAGFYRYDMHTSVHHWQKCRVNGGDHVKKMVFCNLEFALSNSITELILPVVVPIEISRRHYFWSNYKCAAQDNFSSLNAAQESQKVGHPWVKI